MAGGVLTNEEGMQQAVVKQVMVIFFTARVFEGGRLKG